MFDIYEIAPYGSVLIVGLSDDPNKVATKLNLLNQGIELDYPIDHVAGITFERVFHLPNTKGPRQYIIIIMHDKYANTMTIAHETVHAVNFIFKHTGVHLDVDNDEAQAYLTGHIAHNIQLTVDKYKKRKRK